jgi:hypothetical protein
VIDREGDAFDRGKRSECLGNRLYLDLCHRG